MIKPELNDRLEQAFEVCELHLSRMKFACSKVDSLLSLTQENYYNLEDETIGFLDQFIFRFSKLQDFIGTRLFPSVLEYLAEPVAEHAFIDMLNRPEQLNIIPSALNWIEIQKIRNEITHEYPASLNEKIAGLNILFDQWAELKRIVIKCRSV